MQWSKFEEKVNLGSVQRELRANRLWDPKISVRHEQPTNAGSKGLLWSNNSVFQGCILAQLQAGFIQK